MKKILIANCKSKLSVTESGQWIDKFLQSVHITDDSGVQVVVVPSFTSLSIISQHMESSLNDLIALGCQDISPFPAGSYTGAVSTHDLMGLPVRYGIVGHSERRRYFHETHQEVANKVSRLIEAEITPIVCVDDEYIQQQAAAIAEQQLGKCIVAYEPIEAIGNGHNADVGEVQRVGKNIRSHFGDIPVIYGGSVDAENILEYLLVCDGALVGTASVDPQEFARLIHAAINRS